MRREGQEGIPVHEGDHIHEPAHAAPPRTKGPTRTYENEQIRVFWDSTRCIHVGYCFRALPEVFDPTARPWVDLTGASAERVAQAVRVCPTGALRYEPVAALPAEEPEEPMSVEVRPNGPLYVRGRCIVRDASGEVIADETRLALCRCGASANKPFCDNSHRVSGFRG